MRDSVVRSSTADQALYSTAIHESAHAVLAAVLGIPVQAILIRENEDGSADGWAQIDSDSGTARDRLVVYLAGEVAESFFVGHLQRTTDDALGASDSEQIKALVGVLGEAELYVALGRAERLVRLHRASILRLSHALARHEVVDGRVFIQGEELAVLLPARALSAVPRMQTSQSH
jgi:hypothetical protein